MTNINITNLRKNLFGYISQAVEFNEVINVNTKNGNAVIISEDDYNGLMETLYLSSNPMVKKEILDGMATPVEECIPENEVQW
ncbi:MAG: type II toxin-antitoxin system Phd/YefM family antitoxin [Oscillospiraceae bacterium]|nr:type II toxin-antitoxin system Phd/YefM family antitoxin [Oscillospiraceae bacterium]